MRQKLVWRWEPERPAANSLRLLPSGPDRVGEDCVRPTPAAHMAAAAGKCKMRRSGPPPCPQSSFEINAAFAYCGFRPGYGPSEIGRASGRDRVGESG